MKTWYPIIYSRTYQVDFHMLVMPHYINSNEDKKWLNEHIRGTLIKSDDFIYKNSIRWSLFSNQQFCIFGISCLVNNLIKNDENNQQYFHLKGGGSPYAFVGLAIEREKLSKLPNYEQLKKLPGFESIYLSYIEKCWNNFGKSTTMTKQALSNVNEDDWNESKSDNYQENEKRKFYTVEKGENNDDNSRSKIWRNACQRIFNTKEDVSLCFGLPSKQIAKNTIFSEEYNAKQKAISKQTGSSEYSYANKDILNSTEEINRNNQNQLNDKNSHESSSTNDIERDVCSDTEERFMTLTMEETVGLGITSTIGLKAAGLLGAIAFAPIGILIADLVTGKGIFISIRKQWNNSNSEDKNIVRREQSTNNYNNNDSKNIDQYQYNNQNNEDSNELQGFKPKGENEQERW